MRKFLGVVGALVLMMVAMTSTVFALTPEEIAALPNPPEGATLISSQDVVVENGVNIMSGIFNTEKTLTYIGDTPVKAVSFDSETGLYWCDVRAAHTTTDLESGETFVNDWNDFKSFSTFDEAVQSAAGIQKGDSLSVYFSTTATVVFVDSSTGVSSFKCPVKDLADYSGSMMSTSNNKNPPSIKVNVLSDLDWYKRYGSIKCQLKYELHGVDFLSSTRQEHVTSAYVDKVNETIPVEIGSSSGVVEFELSSVYESEFKVCLITDCGNKYESEFGVDFIPDGTTTTFNGPFGTPTVEILGIPSVLVKAPVTLTLKADIPVVWIWGSSVLVDEAVSEVTVDVYENGIYKFEAVSEAGKVTSDSVEIVNIDSSVNLSGAPLELNDKLVQTGLESEVSRGQIIVGVVLLGFAVGLVGIGIVVTKKRGQ